VRERDQSDASEGADRETLSRSPSTLRSTSEESSGAVPTLEAEAARAAEIARWRGWICLASWLLAIPAITWLVGGAPFEGVLLPMWVRVSLALVVGIALVATIAWSGAMTDRARARQTAEGGVPRRGFLGLLGRTLGVSAAGGAGIAAAVAARNSGWITVTAPAIGPQPPVPTKTPPTDPAFDPNWSGATVKSYRRLGRTDARISDISLGSAGIRSDVGEALARAALDRGINYFDTAPDYSESGSELALGKAMQGRRDQVFLATKFCTPKGHLPPGSPVSEYVGVVEASLRRLQTDYVDLVHIHSCDSEERLLDENAHEAFDRLKQAGKVRFLGVSTHTPRLEAVADAAIESGRFDVMMLAYHFGAWPKLSEIIERAAARDIGIVAMKTLKGARHQGLLELSARERRSYPQAAFRWVLSNPSVSALVISFREAQHLDEYLAASGQRPEASDAALLEKYDHLTASTQCRPHCGECLGACPAGLPIHDILRHKMYFESYRTEREAMRLYAELDRSAAICQGCPAPCAGACPHGVQIPDQMREAHRILSPASLSARSFSAGSSAGSSSGSSSGSVG